MIAAHTVFNGQNTKNSDKRVNQKLGVWQIYVLFYIPVKEKKVKSVKLMECQGHFLYCYKRMYLCSLKKIPFMIF